jgi:hypothetical protein
MTDEAKRNLHIMMNGTCAGELYRRLVPEGVRKALDFALAVGTLKHQRWSSSQPRSYYIGAIERHWDKYLAGERFDKEDGQSHLAAMQTRLMQLEDKDQKKDKGDANKLESGTA